MALNLSRRWTKFVLIFIFTICNAHYYISHLVSASWLVNSAGRTLLYGPLKCKVVSVAKLFREVSPNVLNLSKKLKLSFNQNCMLKRANDLKLTRYAYNFKKILCWGSNFKISCFGFHRERLDTRWNPKHEILKYYFKTISNCLNAFDVHQKFETVPGE